MTMRSLSLGLACACLSVLPASAVAQTFPNRPQPNVPGRPQPTFPGQPGAPGQSAPGQRTNVNERHERIKSEAQAASLKGDHEHAVTLLNGVLAENPRDDVALYLRGSARAEMGRQKRDVKLLRDGIADARMAISIKTTDNALYYLPYLYGMSSLAVAENRPEHAEVAVKVAKQVAASTSVKDADKANILYQLGVAHMTLSDAKSAAQDFESALRLNPSHVGAHMGVADAYLRDGDVEKATKSFDRAIAALPRSPLAYNNRGMFRETQGDSAGAIADFTRAMELDEGFYVAMTNRGNSLLNMGNASAAETDFTASLAANPNQDAVYSLRGASRLAQGKIDAATADYTRVIERAPKNPIAWSDHGFARFFAGDYAGALRSLDQAAALDAKLRYLNPWRYYAMALAGRPEKDLEQFIEKNSVEVKDDDWAGGLFAYIAGSLSEEELLKRAESKNERMTRDQQCEAHFFIGQKLAREGKAEEANKHFEKALESGARHLSAYRGAQFALKKIGPGAAGG